MRQPRSYRKDPQEPKKAKPMLKKSFLILFVLSGRACQDKSPGHKHMTSQRNGNSHSILMANIRLTANRSVTDVDGKAPVMLQNNGSKGTKILTVRTRCSLLWKPILFIIHLSRSYAPSLLLFNQTPRYLKLYHATP